MDKLTEQEINTIVDKMLNGTDWNEFWYKVEKKVSEEIDEYEKARFESLKLAHTIVFE